MSLIIIFLCLYGSLIQFIVANQIDVEFKTKVDSVNGASDNGDVGEIENRLPHKFTPVDRVGTEARIIKRHIFDSSNESNINSVESDETISAVFYKPPSPNPHALSKRQKRFGIWRRRPETRSGTTPVFNTDYGLAGTIRDHYVPSNVRVNHQNDNYLFETPNEDEGTQSDSGNYYWDRQTRPPVAWSRKPPIWQPETRSLYGSRDYRYGIARDDARIPSRGVTQSSAKDDLYQRVVDDYDYDIDNLDFYQKWMVHNAVRQREADEASRQPVVRRQPELRSGYQSDQSGNPWLNYDQRYDNSIDDGQVTTNDKIYFDRGIEWKIYKTNNALTRLGTKNGEVVVRIVRPLQESSFNRAVQSDKSLSQEYQESPNSNIAYEKGVHIKPCQMGEDCFNEMLRYYTGRST